jgi:Zn-dependent oligopeptidase
MSLPALESGATIRAMTDRYDYSAMTPETVRELTDECLDAAERLIAQAVEVANPRTFENTLIPLSDAAAAVTTAHGRGARMGLDHPDAGVRLAAKAAQERTGSWREALFQREDVAEAVRAFPA